VARLDAARPHHNNGMGWPTPSDSALVWMGRGAGQEKQLVQITSRLAVVEAKFDALAQVHFSTSRDHDRD
jgi:hypothetical protein